MHHVEDYPEAFDSDGQVMIGHRIISSERLEELLQIEDEQGKITDMFCDNKKALDKAMSLLSDIDTNFAQV